MGPPLSNNAWSAIAFAHPTPLLPSSALQIPRGHAGKLSYPKVNLTCRHWHCQQKYTLEYVKVRELYYDLYDLYYDYYDLYYDLYWST